MHIYLFMLHLTLLTVAQTTVSNLSMINKQ